ncbi:hypothetical protein TcasGA2_TC011765 [Tribolium castaneum]|uniref:Uncharacterized protein n=1 Tax=Tribolium castaneum TaxID=7070 RepID=D6WZV1_TRICA|nr:hypothetical protein TcasGA2_TC011765 [Tribolium castaneum]
MTNRRKSGSGEFPQSGRDAFCVRDIIFPCHLFAVKRLSYFRIYSTLLHLYVFHKDDYFYSRRDNIFMFDRNTGYSTYFVREIASWWTGNGLFGDIHTETKTERLYSQLL